MNPPVHHHHTHTHIAIRATVFAFDMISLVHLVRAPENGRRTGAQSEYHMRNHAGTPHTRTKTKATCRTTTCGCCCCWCARASRHMINELLLRMCVSSVRDGHGAGLRLGPPKRRTLSFAHTHPHTRACAVHFNYPTYAPRDESRPAGQPPSHHHKVPADRRGQNGAESENKMHTAHTLAHTVCGGYRASRTVAPPAKVNRNMPCSF